MDRVKLLEWDGSGIVLVMDVAPGAFHLAGDPRRWCI
ncbi:hypothetical protein ABIC09_006417 [Bradyrhizobium sp. S3.12.5]